MRNALKKSRRLWGATGAPLLLALTLLTAGPAGAIGPETPVDFLDVYVSKGFMLLVIEPKQVDDVDVMRIVHQDGKPLAREKIDWKGLRMLEYTAPITRPDDFHYRDPREDDKYQTERVPSGPRPVPSIEAAQPRSDVTLGRGDKPEVVNDGPPYRVGVLIPLESKPMAELKDGAYAEKFVARARLAGEPVQSKPLTMIRWSHFVMRDGQPHFISQGEYSRLVDPPVHGVDGAGEKIQLNLGRDVKAEVPLEKTKFNQAVPLGRLGGVLPERDDSRKPCDEAQEQ